MLAVLVALAGHHLQGFVTGNPLYCRKIDTGLDEVSYGGMPQSMDDNLFWIKTGCHNLAMKTLDQCDQQLLKTDIINQFYAWEM